MDFAATIIFWYRQNARPLPWRETRDPYTIWLSEVILQQTRVDQGMRYFLHFCERYPTLKDLALATEDQILKSWQGLGYYSRARNMHKTANIILSEHKGIFPGNYDELIRLKGIGPYTAAAIASFAYGEKKAVVDGNVIRVLARVFAVEEAIDSVTGKKIIRQLADELIPEQDPATFNQAIMEFGALQCVPKNPDCRACPLRDRCGALIRNKVKQLPFKGKKTSVKDLHLQFFLIRRGDHYFVRKRDAAGIWKNMYELPQTENMKPENPAEMKQLLSAIGIGKPLVPPLSSAVYRHQLSHRNIYAVFHEIRIGKKTALSADWIAVKWKEQPNGAVPRLIERFLEERFEKDN